MSWPAILELIRSEAGPEAASRIEARCRREIQGLRVTVPSRSHPSDDEIDAALRRSGHNVSKAARLLEVAPVTIYRVLTRRLQPKEPAGPPPRIVR